MQRWLIFIILIVSPRIRLDTLSIHGPILIHIADLILFTVASRLTDCQCRTLHASFLNNAHFLFKFITLLQFRFYLLSQTLIIDSRITEVVLSIHLLKISVIAIIWEIFLRLVSFEIARVIVCKKTCNGVSWIAFILHFEHLLLFIKHNIFGLWNSWLLCLFYFIVIVYQPILIVEFSVFFLTVLFPYNLIRILNLIVVAIDVISMIFVKVSYVNKAWIVLLLALL